MDLIDRLREIAATIPKLREQGLIKTEEGTKTALILPFINALGYNVFDPTEVTPELVADVGTKKGEKVDYAILRDGHVIIIIECKAFGTDLSTVHASQLFRYFSVTEARFGVLTNGITYQFYTDLESPNKMDDKPFLVIDLMDIKEPLIEELKKFTKAAFDLDKILSTASELKYTSAIKQIITAQLTQPTEDFVRFFASQVYSGQLRQHVLAQFTEITKRAWREVINDRMKETFTKAAEEVHNDDPAATEAAAQTIAPDRKIVTTEEEMEAFRIIRAIVREIVDVKRIVLRDAQSYCSIIFDDSNRKPICRIYFDGSRKQIGFLDESRNEEKIQILALDDLYLYADKFKQAVQRYLN